MNHFYNRSLITIDSVLKEDMLLLFEKAEEMKRITENKGGDERLKGKILAALFYEPSSRTFSSFITSMQRLGGGFIPLNGMANTSAAKGETIEDTAKVFSIYTDIISIRHPEVGIPARFAQNSSVPVINAGDGKGEHPTQALLDIYTISRHFPSFAELTVGMVGDLLNGRTVHSLTKALLKMGVKSFIFISPNALKMPQMIIEEIEEMHGKYIENTEFQKNIPDMDIIYMTRVQKERFTDLSEYERYKLAYILDSEMMDYVEKKAVIMHPLPRVGEINPAIDSDPRALYIREEMRNGLYVRMALLDLILLK